MGKHAGKIAALVADEKGKPIQRRTHGYVDDSDWKAAIPIWNFFENEYREKPFEPEVGKIYMFSDDGETWVSDVYIRMEGVKYVTFYTARKSCRPLTEEEIGK